MDRDDGGNAFPERRPCKKPIVIRRVHTMHNLYYNLLINIKFVEPTTRFGYNAYRVRARCQLK